MKLSIDDLKKLATLANIAVQRAGLIIAEYAQKDFSVYSKAAGSSAVSQVVTEVDYLSQNIILDCLKASISKYDLGLLTEEDTDDHSRFTKDYFWCIDPLDGTYSFVEKEEGYSVSIALVSKTGQPMIGVIYNPIKEDTYVAITGVGMFKNDEEWEPENNNTDTFTFFQDRSFLANSDDYKQDLQEFVQELGYKSFEIVTGAGAVMNAIQVMEQEHSCYFKLPKVNEGGGSLWDFSATACAFEQLQFYALDIQGCKLDLNRKESTFMNEKGIIYTRSQTIKNALVKKYGNDIC